MVEDDFLFGAICNSTSVGGVLTLDPEIVDLRDNKLEILLVRAPKNLAEIHECIVALNAQKYNCALERLDFQQEKGMVSSLPLGL